MGLPKSTQSPPGDVGQHLHMREYIIPCGQRETKLCPFKLAPSGSRVVWVLDRFGGVGGPSILGRSAVPLADDGAREAKGHHSPRNLTPTHATDLLRALNRLAM